MRRRRSRLVRLVRTIVEVLFDTFTRTPRRLSRIVLRLTGRKPKRRWAPLSRRRGRRSRFRR